MSVRTIQVRPSRNRRWQKQGGWETFEAEGVCPVYCGASAREQALSYTRQCAGYGRAEIRVLNPDASLERVIAFNQRGDTNDIRDLLELDDQY
jgi:hypothetical protein